MDYPVSVAAPASDAAMQRSISSSSVPVRGFAAINLGYHTKLICLSLADFVRLSVVANREYLSSIGDDDGAIAQRSLNERHATELAKYMLRGLLHAAQAYRRRSGAHQLPALDELLDRMGRQSYLALAPIVATIPEVQPSDDAIPLTQVKDPAGQLFGQILHVPEDRALLVIDGQHRRYGANLALRFLDELTQSYRYPKKPALFPAEKGEVPTKAQIDVWLECAVMARRQAFVAIEVHLGLSVDQQRQLFYDLNARGLKVAGSQAVTFDDANPAVRFIKTLQESGLIKLSEKPLATWDDDEGGVLYKDAVTVTSLALANAKSEKGVQVRHGDEAHLELAERMWKSIAAIPEFGTTKARKKTVAAQPVVLKGIARAVYESAWLDQEPESASKLIDALPRVDFSHGNPLWRLYLERQLFEDQPDLASYAPDQPPSNGFSELDADGLVHFRPNHADIYPIIASLLRKMVGLPARARRGSASASPV